jgi:predicted membrane protein
MRPQAIQIAPSYIVPIDAAIMCFACIYEFSLSIDAMRHKNNILLFAICVSNVFAMAFAAMQYPAMQGFSETMPKQRAMHDIPLVDISRNIWPQIRGPQFAVPIFIGLCTLGIWGLAFQLHKQYAWSIYRSVQGDSRIRARLLAYEVSV